MLYGRWRTHHDIQPNRILSLCYSQPPFQSSPVNSFFVRQRRRGGGEEESRGTPLGNTVRRGGGERRGGWKRGWCCDYAPNHSHRIEPEKQSVLPSFLSFSLPSQQKQISNFPWSGFDEDNREGCEANQRALFWGPFDNILLRGSEGGYCRRRKWNTSFVLSF